MDHWGVSPCCSNPPVAKADHRNDTNTPINTTESHPHPPKPPRPSGVTNVGPTTAIATHNLAGPLCPNEGRDTIDKCCAPDSHIATVWTCPTPTDTHTARRWTNNTHTQSKQSRCVPFSDPHVHKVARSNDTRQECNHSSANTLGPVHHMARTHQADDKSKGRKKKGVYISKGFCANADLCPLASPRVALVGVCLLRHPDNGNTR